MSMEVANTILQQLGGRKFITMTGAKNFIGSDNSLIFALPNKMAKGGINKVRITLNTSDYYDIEWLKIRGTTVTVVAPPSTMVDAESLQAVFTSVTGLHTRL